MSERGQRVDQIAPVGTHLNAERTLPGGREHLLRLKGAANAFCQTQAFQPGSGQHNRLVLAFVQLAQAGVDVATQRHDIQIGSQAFQQHQPTQTGGADHCTGRQRVQRRKMVGHQRIARVFASQDTGQGKAIGQVHGHIFKRVHRQVGAPFAQRHFQLFDE